MCVFVSVKWCSIWLKYLLSTEVDKLLKALLFCMRHGFLCFYILSYWQMCCLLCSSLCQNDSGVQLAYPDAL